MTDSPRWRGGIARLAIVASIAAIVAAVGVAAPASAVYSTTDCAQVIAIVVRESEAVAGTYSSNPRVYGAGGYGRLAGHSLELQQESVWNIRRVGLKYPAKINIFDYAASRDEGVRNLRDELNSLASRCSGSRTVLMGYSQGAHVIGNVLAGAYATGGLSSTARSRIAAVVFFGDPTFRMGESYNHGTFNSNGIFARPENQLSNFASRMWSYCDRGDVVCSPPDTGQYVHESYTTAWHRDRAVAFIEGKLWVSGSPSGGGGSTPVPGPSSSEGVTLQEIAQAGGYTGPVDGVPGVNTWLGVQQVTRGYGYTGPIDGAPGTNTYAAMQRLAQKGGYTGPVDGALGVNSWKGIQTVLRGFGYAGPIDGLPGANTYSALQRMAKLGGYTGPIDGALGANSWKGVQKVMSGYGYTGPIDGVPGTNTYAALQRMAQLGGYTGPVDGVPGPNTWAALARLV